jgi:hypothetical protein
MYQRKECMSEAPKPIAVPQISATNISRKATIALQAMRALRKLPKSDAVRAAEIRATKSLNSFEITQVALALADDEARAGGAQ